jgi:hypothetical protein
MGCSALMAAYPFETHTLLQIIQFVKLYSFYTSDNFID